LDKIFLIDPEFFSNHRNISLLLKVLTKLKREFQVDIFLIPDPVYDFLTDLLKPFAGKIDEYSTEKWLTGIIPMDVSGFIKKIYSILKREDVKRYSEVIENFKLSRTDPMAYIIDGLDKGFGIVCLPNLCDSMKEKGLWFIERGSKMVKNVKILTKD